MEIPFIDNELCDDGLPNKVIIIGAGCAGLSMAHALLDCSSKCTIAIFDPILARLLSPETALDQRAPCPSASYDTGRIVRDDYLDPFYRMIARSAMDTWQNQKPWSDFYHHNGLVLTGNDHNDKLRETYHLSCQAEAKSEGSSIEELSSTAEVRKASGAQADVGNWGYLNHRAGWVDADRLMCNILEGLRCDRVRFVPERVASLEKNADAGAVVGVRLESGERHDADVVVLATGPWTSTLVDTGGRTVATGEAVAYVDITPVEAQKFDKMPSLVSFDEHICFTPPQDRPLLRMALHRDSCVHEPHPPLYDDEPGTVVIDSHKQQLREALRKVAPSLAERSTVRFRYCWYDDTTSGHFLISYHPEYRGLFMFHGLGGDGLKFTPVLGYYAVQGLRRKLPASLAHRWAWAKVTNGHVIEDNGLAGWR